MTATTEARCDRTDLPASMCAHCRRLPWDPPSGVMFLDPTGITDDVVDEVLDAFDAPARPARAEPGPWFMARFVGDCSGCGTAIEHGDEIRADGASGYEGRCCQ